MSRPGWTSSGLQVTIELAIHEIWRWCLPSSLLGATLRMSGCVLVAALRIIEVVSWVCSRFMFYQKVQYFDLFWLFVGGKNKLKKKPTTYLTHIPWTKDKLLDASHVSKMFIVACHGPIRLLMWCPSALGPRFITLYGILKILPKLDPNMTILGSSPRPNDQKSGKLHDLDSSQWLCLWVYVCRDIINIRYVKHMFKFTWIWLC